MNSQVPYDPNQGYWFDEDGRPHAFVVASAQDRTSLHIPPSQPRSQQASFGQDGYEPSERPQGAAIGYGSQRGHPDATSQRSPDSGRAVQASQASLPAGSTPTSSQSASETSCLRLLPSFLQDNHSSDDDDEAVLERLSLPPPPQDSTSRGKGKRRATEHKHDIGGGAKRAKSSSQNANRTRGATKQGGRPRGSSNYTDGDLAALLRYVGLILPIGQHAWQKVAMKYNKWALKNSRPKREVKPLKAKYDNIVRLASEKPTGATEIPWYMEEALKIEASISEKSHTQEFRDSDSGDEEAEPNAEGVSLADEVDSHESHLHVESDGSSPEPMNNTHMTGARSPMLRGVRDQPASLAPTRGTRRDQTNHLLSAISASLDPSAREARDEARFVRRFAQDEIHRLTEDNRLLRERCNILQDRNQELMQQLQEQKMEVTRLQTRIETFQTLHGTMAREAELGKSLTENHWQLTAGRCQSPRTPFLEAQLLQRRLHHTNHEAV
ncbi:hypothetical protein BN946_scf184844.g86 [Trametes cinnabarina]|uniref:DUF6818 domain-containing protein n=1 Tax=Pycnoporus cinnabarinus TaxID=5643 RepID=A0A060S991_PYCCI|nr:hypothetical protein BN946_scf184844.g86 [Trametes cinnabarina]